MCCCWQPAGLDHACCVVEGFLPLDVGLGHQCRRRAGDVALMNFGNWPFIARGERGNRWQAYPLVLLFLLVLMPLTHPCLHPPPFLPSYPPS